MARHTLRDHEGFYFEEHARGGDVLTKAGTPRSGQAHVGLQSNTSNRRLFFVYVPNGIRGLTASLRHRVGDGPFGFLNVQKIEPEFPQYIGSKGWTTFGKPRRVNKTIDRGSTWFDGGKAYRNL